MAPFGREFLLQDKGVPAHRHPLRKNRHLFRGHDLRRQYRDHSFLIVNRPRALSDHSAS